MKRARIAAFLLGAVLAAAAPARADPANTDPSSRLAAALAEPLVKVDTGFAGAKVTMFAVSDAADDLDARFAAILMGPRRPYSILRHSEEGRRRFDFSGAPAVLSSAYDADLAGLVAPDVLLRSMVDPRYEAVPAAPADPVETEIWRHAFAVIKEEDGLYKSKPDGVDRLNGGLMRADFQLPASAPPGMYDVRILQFSDGSLVAQASAPLDLTRSGAEEALYALAHSAPVAYGLVAVFLGACVGLGGVLLGRR